MKPQYLLLRGFEGILSGMGLHEIEIDFSVLPDGIIVFDGPNGRGKTTIVDNMHHFRLMPSKVNRTYSPDAFSFYDETYGSDARKIFISTMNGVRHKSVVAIDAVKRKQKSYLYEEANGTWKPLNPDGTAESYDAAVEKIFGTPELYFISNFRDQKAKSFSRYSKGDIKEILAELLGIDGLKALSEKASRIRKKLQEHCASLTKEKDDLSRVITGKEEKAAQARETQALLSETTARIQALEHDRNENQEKLHNVTTKIALQEEKERAREKALADIRAKQHELDELTKNSEARLEAFRTKAAALTEKIAGKKSLLAKMDMLKEKAHELARLQEKISNLKNSVKRCDERYVTLNARIADLQATEKLVKDKERELEKIRLSRKHAIETIERGIAELRAKVRRLSEYRCNATDASSCPFVADAREAKQAIPRKGSRAEAHDRKHRPERGNHCPGASPSCAQPAAPCLCCGRKPITSSR